MTKHMSKPLKVKNGNKTILPNFGKLSPSKIITRAYLAKRKEKLINMRDRTLSEMKLIFTKRYCTNNILGQVSLINLL
jgi:hypothetical protein